jgi:basic membrane lipoprotein Med (substrate-binding protein (PBP1-ABC) superfamily)
MPRFVGALLALLLVAPACGDDDDGAESDGADAGEEGGEDIQVRVVTVTPTTAGTWDPSHFRAYTAAAEAGGWDLEIAEALPYGEAESVFDRWGQEGVDVVFSTDNGFEDALLNAAERYPDTAWAMMSALSTTRDLPNVTSYSIDWCELGYLQGVAGALVSEQQFIGAVGPIEIFPAQLTIESMEVGAEEAASGTQVELVYTGDFVDVVKAQETASNLIADGADVIVAITQGGVSPQIAARTQESGALYIGTFDDEEQYAPEATVTSGVLNFEQGYTEVVETWLADTFEPVINVKGVADDFIRFTEFSEGFEDAGTEFQEFFDRVAEGDVSFEDGSMCAEASG